MRLSSLYSIFTSCSLVLALDKSDSRWRYWNTTTAQPTPAPIGPIPINNSWPFQVTTTVQIQIGGLFGSGVISFSDISSGGMSAISTLDSTISGEPCQTDIPFTSSPSMSLPYRNTTYPFQTQPPLNFNTTWGHVTSQSPGVQASTTSPAELGLTTGSGVQINRRLPSLLAIFNTIVILLL